MTGGGRENILIIKHGALGDVVLAQSPFQAIRKAHPSAHLTLLTTKSFRPFLEKSGLFDEIWIDEKPKLWNVTTLRKLRQQLREGQFTRVYDLQTSSRSGSYLKLFSRGQMPEWSGIAPRCSHPHVNPDRKTMHTIERQADQLYQAGIKSIPKADFSWAEVDISKYLLPDNIALLVPGGSAHRPEKRWPAEKYAELAEWLQINGIAPVLLGGAAEMDVIELIKKRCSGAIDLSDKTNLAELASLGMKASVAVGNDTGPLHLVAAVGCPVTVLFSSASDPARARPRGVDVTVLREENLNDLSLEVVLKTLKLAKGCE